MAEPGNDAVIRVRDLVVGFAGASGAAPVLDRLSLDVFRGEILGFVGASGAGKSVLMRSIIGLLPKREGLIEVFGVDVGAASESVRRSVERRWGILFQQGALFSALTVLQNVQFPIREYLDLSGRLLDEVALAKLEMVGLTADVRDKYPSELSGGMTKRVALARARARSRDRLSRRADLGPRPDRRRRVRRAHPHPAAHVGADRLHGDARPRQPAHGVRPHRGAGRGQGDHGGTDPDPARVRASVGEILFSRQAFARRRRACGITLL